MDSNNKTTRVQGNFFFGIGAPKTGTTWLYACLDKHPEVRLPILKELHFFDEIVNQKPSFISRFFFKEWYGFRTRRLFGKSIYGIIRIRQSKEWLWVLRLLFLRRSVNKIESYRRLLADGHYTGDITPLYCDLPKEVIAEIFKVFPEARLIYLIRNPVERDWSLFKMTRLKKKGKKEEKAIEEEFADFIERGYKGGDIVGTIKNWLTYYPEDQLLIGFHDEIQDTPLSFLNKVTKFINVTDFGDVPVKNKVNKGLLLDMPSDIRQQLYLKNREQILALAEYFSLERLPKKWKAEMEEIVGSREI